MPAAMRLALKISWVVMATTFVGLGVQAKVRLDREVDLIDQEMHRDQRVLGRALVPVLEASYDVGGEEALDRSLRAAYQGEREIDLRLLEFTQLPAAIAETLEQGPEAAPATTSQSLTTYFTIELPDRPRVALVLSEPRTPLDEFVQSAIREFALSLITLVAMVTVIGALCGYLIVGRRVEKLVSAARAVSSGTYWVELDVGGWDELATLSREMSKMTEQLEQAQEKARKAAEHHGQLTQRLHHADRLATVGALASRVAHDIGTPLHVVSARAKMIARREVEGPDIVDNAAIVVTQAERIKQKVQELLDFSRQKSATPQTIDVHRVLAETASLLDSLARAHGVRLTTEVGARALVAAEPLQLQQALANIIVNAIHAAPRGSVVTVDVDRTDVDAPPPHSPAGSFVRVAVSDAGPGLSPEVRESVFEPYFTTKDVGLGTGLGLPIAREVVRGLGGFIRVEDRVPSGTTFHIYIPEASTDD